MAFLNKEVQKLHICVPFLLKRIVCSSLYTVTMSSFTGLKHCKVALAFAVIFDIFGFTSLFLGLFVPLEVKGRDFGDLLVYTGALLVLISLGGWVMWYSGNIEGMPTQKELGRIGTVVDRLARNLSRKIHTHVYRGP
ncbi:transmembrane protein 238a [Xyrauchen texanus]|uniref:transmembrane protein 238a n=1 Tax=Xyrauchen texanus TaxID=154827 RepID=UPI002242A516|nr:transmembrane protein 238a [Xyrauchen texanus]